MFSDSGVFRVYVKSKTLNFALGVFDREVYPGLETHGRIRGIRIRSYSQHDVIRRVEVVKLKFDIGIRRTGRFSAVIIFAYACDVYFPRLFGRKINDVAEQNAVRAVDAYFRSFHFRAGITRRVSDAVFKVFVYDIERYERVFRFEIQLVRTVAPCRNRARFDNEFSVFESIIACAERRVVVGVYDSHEVFSAHNEIKLNIRAFRIFDRRIAVRNLNRFGNDHFGGEIHVRFCVSARKFEVEFGSIRQRFKIRTL